MNRLALRIALALTAIAQRLLPLAQRDWGLAMLGEVVTIARGSEALHFALGCLGHAVRARAGESPVLLGSLCAGLATAFGMVFMMLAGAPLRYLAVNGAALVIGLLALANLRLLSRLVPVPTEAVTAGLTLLLVGLTTQGIAAQGALRWVQFGEAVIQPSLILIPSLVVAAARSASRLMLICVTVAALTLAAQPDRAMAGAFALALTGAWVSGCGRVRAAAALAGWAGFAVTLVRPDLGERMPYVDQILWLAFDGHLLAGLAVWAGSLLLLAPAMLLWPVRPDLRAGLAVHALIWGGAVLAAALGNYPTPLVGYGSSAVIGYCLSLLALVPPPVRQTGDARRDPSSHAETDRDHPLRMALR